MQLYWLLSSYYNKIRDLEVSYLFIVDLQVLLQVRPRSELLITLVAHIRLLAGMYPLVPNEIRDLKE